MSTASSGFLLQSTFGSAGYFEVVVPSPRGGFVHVWRNNDAPGFPWSSPDFFGSGYSEGASLFQQVQGDLHVLARAGDRLAHYARRNFKWQDPDFFASGVAGIPAWIQSDWGFEAVAPLASGGLGWCWRAVADPAQPWTDLAPFAASSGPVDAVSLIQSNFAGNLEAVGLIRNNGAPYLAHFFCGEDRAWFGPEPIPLGGAAPAGVPGFIQGRYGMRGNFELVVPLASGGLAHLWRNNDSPSLNWSAPAIFGNGAYTAASLIHSNFGTLEAVARSADRWEFWHRDNATLQWIGPVVAYQEPQMDAARYGDWQVPASSAVVGIHACLLRTGKVLMFSYLTDEDEGVAVSCVFDPVTGASVRLPNEPLSMLCGGHAFLGDGSLLAGGGTSDGLTSVHTFVPQDDAGAWHIVAGMPEGRWYPTCTALPDGSVAIISGTTTGGAQPGAPLNDTYTIYSPVTGLSPQIPAPYLDTIAPVSTYPFVFLLPSGQLILYGWNRTFFIDPTTGSFQPGPATLREEPRNYPVEGTGVLLPLMPDTSPPYRARILLIGGGGVPPQVSNPATDTCEILDLGDPRPQFRWAAPLASPRLMGDAVLLPDGSVLVVNGSSAGWSESAASPVYAAELYDPRRDAWTTLASARVPRLYHSTAILLPDARVMTAGTDEASNIEPYKRSELRAEFFSPPYLFRGPRPVISSAPSQIPYGAAFDVTCPDAPSIASVALIRPAAVTHSFNMEQRFVGLAIQSRTSATLTLASPPSSRIAPPGYYMLFLVNETGVPSVAVWLRLQYLSLV